MTTSRLESGAVERAAVQAGGWDDGGVMRRERGRTKVQGRACHLMDGEGVALVAETEVTHPPT